MEIIQEIPPKPTKVKKYMFVCKTCKKEEGGLNYSKTKFIADYPKDFFTGVLPQEYCSCPVCRARHSKCLSARLRYLIYSFRNNDTLR